MLNVTESRSFKRMWKCCIYCARVSTKHQQNTRNIIKLSKFRACLWETKIDDNLHRRPLSSVHKADKRLLISIPLSWGCDSLRRCDGWSRVVGCWARLWCGWGKVLGRVNSSLSRRSCCYTHKRFSFIISGVFLGAMQTAFWVRTVVQ